MKPVPTPQIVLLQSSQLPPDSSADKEPDDFGESAAQLPSKKSDSLDGKNSYGDLIANFLQSKNLASRSEKAYRLDFSRFNQWLLLKGVVHSKKCWQEVTYQQLSHFKVYLKQELKLSDSTVRRTLSTLKQFFDWMIDKDLLLKNPARKLELPKVRNAITSSLSPDEVRWLFEAAATTTLPERNRAIVSLLLHGLKAEEVCRLNIGDLAGATITLHKEEQKIVKLPLSQQTQDYLQQYLVWRQSHSEENRKAGQIFASTSPLFISYSSRSFHKRLGYNGLYWLITKEISAIARQLAQAEGKEISSIYPQRISDLAKHLSQYK